MLKSNTYKNIYWFLIDGMSPEYLMSCGNNNAELNFFDELIVKGSVFSDVATTGAGTHTSMHSIFSSLMPSCNEASGWAKEALRNFRQEIYTITDILKLNGYKTFRYCDADGERTVPMSGFDVWESSGYKISDLLSSTEACMTERRERFIDEVNECADKKFVYHHNLLLHELNAKMGSVWTSEGYLENIKIAASEFKKLYEEYNISEDDLIIISSDHGVVLDIPWQDDGMKNGERHYEQSVRAFCALIGKGIPNKVLDQRISSLDIAPTLLKFLFDLDFNHQGHSQEHYIFEGKYESFPCYREKGSYTVSTEMQNPLKSDVYYVWDDKMKYVYGERDPRCEWLIDLSKDKDYTINLKEKFPDKVDSLKRKIRKNILEADINMYIDADRRNLLPAKREIDKFFSVVVDCQLDTQAWEDLIDIAGGYYEIIYLGKENDIPLKFRNQYKVRIINKYLKKEKVSDYCSGKWVVCLDKKKGYSEYFLSDLYRCIYKNKEVAKIVGDGFIAMKKECNENKLVLKCSDLQVRCIMKVEKKHLQVKSICGRAYAKAKNILKG